MSELAIDGGPAVVPGGIDPEWPIHGEPERAALLEVLDSDRWCSAGYYFDDPGESAVRRFERRIADYVGTDHATAVPNGTQALELALRAVGLEPGDEVIVPAVTFVASASAVVLAGGIPRFVDVDPDTYQIDPDAAAAAVTDRTVAIEPVHYGGYPADMDRILDVAADHDLAVIEDAAEAHGTEWRGEHVGSMGDVGCFSLQQGKPLTCGEGGVVTYDDPLADRIHARANLGRSAGGDPYEHHVPAGNYRLSEFLGALGLAQFDRFEAQTATREENGDRLARGLADVEGVTTLEPDPRVTRRGYYFYFLRFDETAWGVGRDAFLAGLRAEGIPCSTAHNDPLYRNPAFADIDPALLHGRDVDYATTRCPTAERIYDTEVVALDKDVLLDREHVAAVLAVLEKLRENADTLRAAAGDDRPEE